MQDCDAVTQLGHSLFSFLIMRYSINFIGLITNALLEIARRIFAHGMLARN